MNTHTIRLSWDGVTLTAGGKYNAADLIVFSKDEVLAVYGIISKKSQTFTSFDEARLACERAVTDEINTFVQDVTDEN